MATCSRRVLRNDRGVVYVEFLMVFFPVLLLFLGIVQLALIRAAGLVVRDAALRGARSAVVVLDDDPEYYNGVPRGSLAGSSPLGGGLPQRTLSLLGLQVERDPDATQGSRAGPRFQAIRDASYVALATLAPSLSWFQRELVMPLGSLDALHGGYASRFGLGYSLFNRGATAITVGDVHGSTAPRVDPHATVRVSIVYLYHCGIPVVSALICRHATAFKSRLAGVEDPLVLKTLLDGTARFALLEAAVALPNQGADYHGDHARH